MQLYLCIFKFLAYKILYSFIMFLNVAIFIDCTYFYCAYVCGNNAFLSLYFHIWDIYIFVHMQRLQYIRGCWKLLGSTHFSMNIWPNDQTSEFGGEFFSLFDRGLCTTPLHLYLYLNDNYKKITQILISPLHSDNELKCVSLKFHFILFSLTRKWLTLFGQQKNTWI